MTPDELSTRVFKQAADLAATRMALDALMMALPGEQQQLWLQALKTLAATHAANLGTRGGDAMAVRGQIAAIAQQIARLEHAQKGVKRADGAN